MMSDEYSISRRKALRNIGAVGAFSTMMGAAPGTALAASDEPGITELSGETAQTLIDEALNSSEYSQLMNALLSEGIVIESVETKAYHAKFTDGRETDFVSHMLKGDSANQSTDIVLSFDGIMDSKAAIATRNDKKQITEFKEFHFSGGSVVKNVHDLTYIWEDDGVSASAYNYCSDFPDTISCTECNYIVRGLNTLTCSLQSAAYCSVITAQTGVGPLVCAAAVGVSCVVLQTVATWNACEQMCAC